MTTTRAALGPAANITDAAGGAAITVTMNKVLPTETLSPWIRLVSPSGITVGQNLGPSTAEISVMALEGGTYTVIVGSWDSFFGSTQYAGNGRYVLIWK